MLKLDTHLFAIALAQRLALVQHRTAGRQVYALQHLDGGGFAGAIGAKQAETDALGDGKTDAIHRDDTGIMFDEIGGADDGMHKNFNPGSLSGFVHK